MIDNITRGFLSEIGEVARLDIPNEVAGRAKESLLDYIGVTYAGVQYLGHGFEALLTSAEDESGLGFVLGRKEGVPLKDAVFLNGLAAHALDCDDGVNAGIIHLGSPIYSLLLPLAVKHEAGGEEFLRAAVVGYEAAWTLAMSIQPKHKLLGYHATGTCGMLGAIVAGSYLLGYTKEERFRAFSVGCVSAGGTLKVLEDGSQLKPYNVAKAALLALVSLQMGKAGFDVPDDALSGERGFLTLMTGSDDVELQSPLRDGRHAIMRTYTKPYAACRYCHPSIEAAIALGEAAGHDPRSVDRIEVATYELAVDKHDHRDVRGEPSSAKMSIPYGVAVGFLRGRAGLREYLPEEVRSAEVVSLCEKVSVRSDDRFTAAFPNETTALVTVHEKGGRIRERRVDHPLGEPENPLGREGVCVKFREMMTYAGRPAGFCEEVIGCVFSIKENMGRLVDLLGEA